MVDSIKVDRNTVYINDIVLNSSHDDQCFILTDSSLLKMLFVLLCLVAGASALPVATESPTASPISPVVVPQPIFRNLPVVVAEGNRIVVKSLDEKDLELFKESEAKGAESYPIKALPPNGPFYIRYEFSDLSSFLTGLQNFPANLQSMFTSIGSIFGIGGGGSGSVGPIGVSPDGRYYVLIDSRLAPFIK